MTTLADLTQDVYDLTKRPDLVAETKQAIKSATLKVHQLEFWQRDLFESGIIFPTTDFFQSLQFKTILPNWRAAKYFRKYDPITGAGGKSFTIQQVEQAFDDYALERTDIAYLAGNLFNFKSSDAFNSLLFGCYLNPDVTDANYASWIADQHRYIIVSEALRKIYQTIGKDKEAANAEGEFREQVATLIISNVSSMGY